MIWAATACGRGFDLLAPKATDIDLRNHIAVALSRTCRFNGAAAWTVADHLVTGDDALRQAGASPRIRLVWLLHDAHEAYSQDITRPVQMALAALVEQAEAHVYGEVRSRAALGGSLFGTALKLWQSLIDKAIYANLGVMPPTASEAEAVRVFDIRMCGTELRQIVPRQARHRDADAALRAEPIKTLGALKPRKPEWLAAEYAARVETLITMTSRAGAA